jgi:hypothetical protein
MTSHSGQKLLLSIIELGGYPNFRPLYERLGYEVVIETRMRKAIARIRQRCPDVIVAEFNFQSDFRDRTSSLESLLAVVQRLPDTRVIVFYEEEFSPQFNKLRNRLPIHQALCFPVQEPELQQALLGLDLQQPDGADGGSGGGE